MCVISGTRTAPSTAANRTSSRRWKGVRVCHRARRGDAECQVRIQPRRSSPSATRLFGAGVGRDAASAATSPFNCSGEFREGVLVIADRGSRIGDCGTNNATCSRKRDFTRRIAARRLLRAFASRSPGRHRPAAAPRLPASADCRRLHEGRGDCSGMRHRQSAPPLQELGGGSSCVRSFYSLRLGHAT